MPLVGICNRGVHTNETEGGDGLYQEEPRILWGQNKVDGSAPTDGRSGMPNNMDASRNCSTLEPIEQGALAQHGACAGFKMRETYGLELGLLRCTAS